MTQSYHRATPFHSQDSGSDDTAINLRHSYISSITDVMTDEQKREFDLKNSRQEADAIIPFVSMSMLASIVCQRARKLVRMVRDSHTLTGRGEHQIITDMSTPRALQLVTAIEQAVYLFFDKQVALIDKSDYFRAIAKQTGVDISEAWAVANEQFTELTRQAIRGIDQAIKQQMLSVCRPFDTAAFCYVARLVFLAEAFTNFRFSFRGVQPVEHARIFAPIDIAHKLRELINAIELRDVDGRILLFFFSRDERKRWVQSAGKKWFGKHLREEYHPIDIMQLMNSEEIERAGFEMSRTLFYMPNIDQIVQQAFQFDPEFRNAFRRGCWLSCMKSFEQNTCMIAMRNGNFARLVPKLERFLDKIDADNEGRKRKSQPLVGYTQDKNKQLIFLGIWHSAYEAHNETCADYFSILKALNHNIKNFDSGKYCTDDRDNIWLSARQFLTMIRTVKDTTPREEYPIT